MVSSAASLDWYYKIFSSYNNYADKYNFKLLTNFSSQHFANKHQRLHLRRNIFYNQSSQYTAVLDCMKALIAKLYLAAKQFFLGRESWCVLTKCCELKYMLRFHFAPPIDWTTVFSCIIQCCELRQFWKGSAEQNVVSRAFYIAKQSSKYWRNKRFELSNQIQFMYELW